jgi:hypothetical protein
MIRRALALATFLAATGAVACSVRQPAITSPATPPSAQPLPFSGRLVDGDQSELPPAVAMSLSKTSTVTFSYREELTHDEYHIPLIITALDPVTYIGAPLGDYGVAAFASLTIMDGDRVLGDYTAKAYVSKSYNLYSEPTHVELEQAARTAVRDKIDEKVYADLNRLTQSIAGFGEPATGPGAK